MSDIKAYVVPFSHMDLFWLGSYEECLSRGSRVIKEAMDMAQKYPEFRFLIEDLVFVNYFLKCHPEKKTELKDLVQKGQIELGPKWAGIDQTPQVGEDLVRNSMYALDYLEKEFGYAPKTMHTGDLPGWTPQYPQIAQKLGIPYIVYTRTGPTDVSLFYWRGLDGTKSLVWYSLNGYGFAWRGGLDISVEKALENGMEQNMRNVLNQGQEPIFVHWGIDLILPGKKLPENLKKWNEVSGIKMAFATPTEYFENAPKTNLRELTGEAPSTWPYSDPQYQSFMSLSLPSVAALLTAERYSAIAWEKGLISEYPASKIRESWLQVLEAMDHNNNGQGFEFTLVRKKAYYENSIFTAEKLTESVLRHIAENVKAPYSNSSYPIVVFNPTSWNRTDIVKAHTTYHGDIIAFDIAKYRKVKMLDEYGNNVEFQQTDIREGVSREEYIRFIARDVPACGYKTYYILPAEESPEIASVCKQEGRTFTTPFYCIAFDEVTGDASVTDLESGRNIISGMFVTGVEELLESGSFNDATTGRRHENIVDSIQLVNNGTISATIEIRGNIGKSKVLQEITVYKDLKKIDIVNTIDLVEWRPLRFEQVFRTGMEVPEVAYGVPYGVNRFDNILPNCAPKRKDEMPFESWRKLRNCIQWLDLTGPEYGITIGSKHRCFSIDKGTVSAVMIKAVLSTQLCYIRNGKREAYPRPAPGRYVFNYTLFPHEKDWAESKSYRTGWDLNYPLIPVTVDDAESEKHLPAHDQFIKLNSDTDSLIMNVFKKAEDSDDLIVRFYETEGKTGIASLYLGDKKIEDVWLCDLRERPVQKLSSSEAIEYHPYEIITLRLKGAGEL